ncbi:MAG: AAA domain-containing protein [Monoraphidium minutum]|nr:MAG: AAA domain-containing protein [Monoraphidium minutum]
MEELNSELLTDIISRSKFLAGYEKRTGPDEGPETPDFKRSIKLLDLREREAAQALDAARWHSALERLGDLENGARAECWHELAEKIDKSDPKMINCITKVERDEQDAAALNITLSGLALNPGAAAAARIEPVEEHLQALGIVTHAGNPCTIKVGLSCFARKDGKHHCKQTYAALEPLLLDHLKKTELADAAKRGWRLSRVKDAPVPNLLKLRAARAARRPDALTPEMQEVLVGADEIAASATAAQAAGAGKFSGGLPRVAYDLGIAESLSQKLSGLNPEQAAFSYQVLHSLAAVLARLEAPEGPPPLEYLQYIVNLLLGPPGTGKTTTTVKTLEVCVELGTHIFLQKVVERLIEYIPSDHSARFNMDAAIDEAQHYYAVVRPLVYVSAQANDGTDVLTARLRARERGNAEPGGIKAVRLGKNVTAAGEEVRTSTRVKAYLDRANSGWAKAEQEMGAAYNGWKVAFTDLDTVLRDMKESDTGPQNPAYASHALSARVALQRAAAAKLEHNQLQAALNIINPATPDFKRKDLKTSMSKRELAAANIICGTLCGAAGDAVRSLRFNYLFVDESCQVPDLELIAAMGLKPRTLALVGDPRQMAPLLRSELAKALGLAETSFERLAEAGVPAVRLRVQHRAHPDIMAYPARAFYDGDLATDPAVALERAEQFAHLIQCPTLPTPLRFFDVKDGRSAKLEGGDSPFNDAEARLAVGIVCGVAARAHARRQQPLEMLMLSPYEAQTRRMRELLRRADAAGLLPAAAFARIDVRTIDASQGREADVVVLSAVRAPQDGAAPSAEADTLSHLASERRYNVAATRGKVLHCTLCHFETAKRADPWRRALADAEERVLVGQPHVAPAAALPQQGRSHVVPAAALPQQGRPHVVPAAALPPPPQGRPHAAPAAPPLALPRLPQQEQPRVAPETPPPALQAPAVVLLAKTSPPQQEPAAAAAKTRKARTKERRSAAADAGSGGGGRQKRTHGAPMSLDPSSAEEEEEEEEEGSRPKRRRAGGGQETEAGADGAAAGDAAAPGREEDGGCGGGSGAGSGGSGEGEAVGVTRASTQLGGSGADADGVPSAPQLLEPVARGGETCSGGGEGEGKGAPSEGEERREQTHAGGAAARAAPSGSGSRPSRSVPAAPAPASRTAARLPGGGAPRREQAPPHSPPSHGASRQQQGELQQQAATPAAPAAEAAGGRSGVRGAEERRGRSPEAARSDRIKNDKNIRLAWGMFEEGARDAGGGGHRRRGSSGDGRRSRSASPPRGSGRGKDREGARDAAERRTGGVGNGVGDGHCDERDKSPTAARSDRRHQDKKGARDAGGGGHRRRGSSGNGRRSRSASPPRGSGRSKDRGPAVARESGGHRQELGGAPFTSSFPGHQWRGSHGGYGMPGGGGGGSGGYADHGSGYDGGFRNGGGGNAFGGRSGGGGGAPTAGAQDLEAYVLERLAHSQRLSQDQSLPLSSQIKLQSHAGNHSSIQDTLAKLSKELSKAVSGAQDAPEGLLGVVTEAGIDPRAVKKWAGMLHAHGFRAVGSKAEALAAVKELCSDNAINFFLSSAAQPVVNQFGGPFGLTCILSRGFPLKLYWSAIEMPKGGQLTVVSACERTANKLAVWSILEMLLGRSYLNTPERFQNEYEVKMDRGVSQAVYSELEALGCTEKRV